MITWILCSIFLLLGYVLGVYVSYPRKKKVKVTPTHEELRDRHPERFF